MSTPKSMWLKVEKTRQINRKKKKTKYIGIPEKKEMVGLGLGASGRNVVQVIYIFQYN
jgi:hypothetical protein